jgi:hypothetical protein
MPTMISGQLSWKLCPDATTPQVNAHIGGNQVTGFSNSATAESLGRDMREIVPATVLGVN